MGIDTEQIKKALNHFENDEFVDAKEILQTQVANAKNDYIKNTLGLKKDPIEVKQPEVEEEPEVKEPSEED